MLALAKMKIVEELVASSSKEELIWLNGYINGFVTGFNKPEEFNEQKLNGLRKKITLVFGTETGNSKKLAAEFAAAAKRKGVPVKLLSLDQYRLADLENEDYCFIIISTHGEGEPPASAKKFYDHIHQNPLSLEKIKFGVLALGDSSYPLFCKAGEDVDAQLKKAGANCIIPLQKCDVDYEQDAWKWFEKLIALFGEGEKTEMSMTPAILVKKSSQRKYYNGRIIANINLNDEGSTKETYHIEIATDELVEYEPGDALALVPQNRKQVVDEIIHLAGIDSGLIVQTAKHKDTVENLLLQHLSVCYLLSSTIKKYASIIQQEIPDTRMDLKDLLRIYPLKDSAQFIEVIQILNPIAPRLYSVSSSPSAHEREIHLTISKNSFWLQDEQKFGLCSTFLGELPVGTELKFYIHRNHAFKLASRDKDIIMIGPGTGIAPFRSFLAERDVTGATGKNWLFFGEQHFTTDFLYQTEIQNYLYTGLLTKVSLAFSRDQEEKIYVQQRLQEEKNEFLKWINEGASLYISGNKKMGSDVEETIAAIIGEGSLLKLKRENRFQKDVY